ncbi:hypothetical protein [Calothrix sp. PCC 7507]|nr:hypothetical protein [Calothrix sp. PCC 7507]AFY35274.1 hypothetical protein Cal7507_4922 [Calothrix sp. PCC 7507]
MSEEESRPKRQDRRRTLVNPFQDSFPIPKLLLAIVIDKISLII